MVSTMMIKLIPQKFGLKQWGFRPPALVLGQKIGEGGTSTIYKGKTNGKAVAIKVAKRKGGMLYSELLLAREINVLWRFRHPNIIAYHGYGKMEEGIFLAMEYVEAPNLEAQLPLPPTDALVVAKKLARALENIHQSDWVHGDIKPENVLRNNSNSIVKLADFSLASPVEKFEYYGVEVFGTPGYLTMRRWEGRPLRPADDIFAWGLLLYEALTGEEGLAVKAPRRGEELNDWKRDWHDQYLGRRQKIEAGNFPSKVRKLLLGTINENPAREFEAGPTLSTYMDKHFPEIPA